MTCNLAAALVAQAGRRPDLRLGTVDDQIDLADALASRRRPRPRACSPSGSSPASGSHSSRRPRPTTS